MLYRLEQQGFSAYLVGGCVRDTLLSKVPKDFDIATDARPEQVKKLFRNCLLIGRRFRLAHIRFGSEIIEVTTFRANDSRKNRKHRLLTQAGMLLRDNVYGTLDEDVWRRDFTVNALYYNIHDGTIVDYCSGLNDLRQKLIRIIGDPQQRYREDPVRLLRAVRFAAKLDFQLEFETEWALIDHASLLSHVPSARLFEEILKLLHSGQALKAFQLLKQYQLLAPLFPQTSQLTDTQSIRWLETACRNTDIRVLNGKTVAPAFLFAVFLWQPLQAEIRKSIAKEALSQRLAHMQAASQVLNLQQQSTTLPRYCMHMMRDIWALQSELCTRHPARIHRLLQHPRFRAAYDFLLLRAQCQEVPTELASWWTQLIESDADVQAQLVEQLLVVKKQVKKPKRTRRKQQAL